MSGYSKGSEALNSVKFLETKQDIIVGKLMSYWCCFCKKERPAFSKKKQNKTVCFDILFFCGAWYVYVTINKQGTVEFLFMKNWQKSKIFLVKGWCQFWWNVSWSLVDLTSLFLHGMIDFSTINLKKIPLCRVEIGGMGLEVFFWWLEFRNVWHCVIILVQKWSKISEKINVISYVILSLNNLKINNFDQRANENGALEIFSISLWFGKNQQLRIKNGGLGLVCVNF